MNVKDAQGEVRKNIIELFAIDKLPADKQEEMINKIGQNIFEATLERVLPTMPEAELQNYENLLKSPDLMPDELMQFFLDRVPNFMQVVIEESSKFRDDAEKTLSQLK